MKAIISWTLWQRRVSTIWWSIGVAAFIFISLIFYPTFRDQAETLQKSFNNLPSTASQLFGGTDLFSSVGFMNGKVFYIMLPLLLGILAIGLGSSLIAKEEQTHTIEGLLARPISRSRLLAAKALAGWIILAIVTLVSLIVNEILILIIDMTIPFSALAIATLECFLLATSFGAIALLLTSFGKTRGSSMGIATAIALGGYVISSLAGSVEWLKFPSYFFPFHYYSSEKLLRGGSDWSNMWILLAISVVAGAIAWRLFANRDLE